MEADIIGWCPFKHLLKEVSQTFSNSYPIKGRNVEDCRKTTQQWFRFSIFWPRALTFIPKSIYALSPFHAGYWNPVCIAFMIEKATFFWDIIHFKTVLSQILNPFDSILYYISSTITEVSWMVTVMWKIVSPGIWVYHHHHHHDCGIVLCTIPLIFQPHWMPTEELHSRKHITQCIKRTKWSNCI